MVFVCGFTFDYFCFYREDLALDPEAKLPVDAPDDLKFSCKLIVNDFTGVLHS